MNPLPKTGRWQYHYRDDDQSERTATSMEPHSFDDFDTPHTSSSLFLDPLQYQTIFANLGILPRSGNNNLVVCKRSLRQVMERFSLVGLHFGIVLIFMQDEEVDSISSDDSVDDLIGRLAWLADNRTRNRISVLA